MLCVQVTDTTRFEQAISRATRYLETQLSAISSDAYALNIVSYALTLARSSQAATAVRKLSALAITEGICTLCCPVYNNNCPTSQPALAGTPEDFVGAKFWLREKMLEFSSVMFTYTICIPFYFYGCHM